MREKSAVLRIATSLLLSVAIMAGVLSLTGCPKADYARMAQRGVRAFPAAVKIIVPDIPDKDLALIKAGCGAFDNFMKARTLGNWRAFLRAWREDIEPLLTGYHNDTLNRLLGLTNLLIGQVEEPEPSLMGPTLSPTAAEPVKVNFKEEDVKALKKLIDEIIK